MATRRWLESEVAAVVRALARVWMPLLIVVVIAVGAYAVVRIRATFGGHPPAATGGTVDETKPFNPKQITYEVTGSAGGSVNVDYLDEDGQPHRVDAAPLPWTFTIVTTLPSMSANIVAQGRCRRERPPLPRHRRRPSAR